MNLNYSTLLGIIQVIYMRYRSLVYSPENMRRTFDHALKFGARSGEIEVKLTN